MTENDFYLEEISGCVVLGAGYEVRGFEGGVRGLYNCLKIILGDELKCMKQTIRILAEIVFSILISIIITLVLDTCPEITIIITLVCMCYLILLDIKIGQINDYNINNKIDRKNDEELIVLHELNEYNKKIKDLGHPYFEYVFNANYKKFIDDNIELCNGNYFTNQYSSDTFGIIGLKFTQDDGSLLAVSSIKDYWKDSFINTYLKEQRKLIKRGVNIKRIFIFSDKNELKKTKKYMIKQKLMGIKVYYIDMSSSYTDPTWADQDFLIQDKKILVDILYKKQAYNSELEKKEYITINERKVKEKLELFNLLFNRAIEF